MSLKPKRLANAPRPTVAVNLSAAQLSALLLALDPTEPTAINVHLYNRLQAALDSLTPPSRRSRP